MNNLKPLFLLIGLLTVGIANGQKTLWAQNGIKVSYDPIEEGSTVGKDNKKITSWIIRCTWENNSGKTFSMSSSILFQAQSPAWKDAPGSWSVRQKKSCSINAGTYPNGSTRTCELRVYTYGGQPGTPGFSGGGGSFK